MFTHDQLTDLQSQLREVEQQLARPEVYASPQAKQLVAEQNSLRARIELLGQFLRVQKQLAEANSLLNDAELGEMARAEVPQLQQQLETTKHELQLAMVPADPNNRKNAIVEIRAGAGGDESSLFAAELARMYNRFAERHGWRTQIMSSSPNEVGGYKEIIFEVRGDDAYGNFKYESGVHRVQRVPVTESAGRIHTSTATVAVLPEAEETDLEINPADLRIDVYRSSGHGGQSVNTTDSAVRITHLPTGLVVTCQDEKSQLKNKAKAMSVLRSRLLAMKAEQEQRERGQARLSQIGSGDRSEKIRTYNFPQDRLTDHRIGYTTHNLERILDGELDGLIEKLRAADLAAALNAAT